MLGTYLLPYGISLSANFIFSSGSPFTRSVAVFLPNFGNYVTVNAEPQASRRNPSWNRLDLRLEKEFAFGDIGRLGMYLDVFNTLNNANIYVSSSGHGYIEEDGSFTQTPTWHKVISVSSPRIIRLGLRFTF